MKTKDADWRHGRTPLYVFKATDAVYEMGRDAFFEFFSENALGARRAFLSVGQMEKEVIEAALDLFHAPADAAGFMTTGGTESIIQAVQTCRDWDRARRKEPARRGNIVASESAHPAFNKAAKLMDLEVRRVPTAADLRADVKALEAAIDDKTMMVVGSAPSFPHGVIDPIAALGQLATKRDLWLHVDACVGGYLAPFAKDIGFDVPDFDLGVAGVSSMSADLHKFGFCPKPASTVFYTSADKARFHGFEFDQWPNGRFATNTIVGTRPAGGVAAAWATFQFLGRAGYRAIAKDLMKMVQDYKSGVEAIDGLRVQGRPHLSIVAFGSDEIDVFRVSEVMAVKGWVPGLVQKPRAIHRMMSLIHAPSMDEYLTDLRAAVGVVRQEGGAAAASIRATY
ncbi:MAG: aspartate aminotransferase family protein [Alphaproteobacteria bacterium]|nr:aspartate aminotransferase family protein [Alphaproteobacteria bacterium]